MKLLPLCGVIAVLASIVAWHPAASPSGAPVPDPDDYRSWAHIKSVVVTPAHKQFASIGGFQHIYANAPAMVGYRTRAFPEGSVIVVDWIVIDDASGLLKEGARKQLDVMVKDSVNFASTGGWGFQRFVGDSKTEHSTTLLPQQCFVCHNSLKKDGLVLSSHRR